MTKIKKKLIIFDLWNTLLVYEGSSLVDEVSSYFNIPYDLTRVYLKTHSYISRNYDEYYIYKTLCEKYGHSFSVADRYFIKKLHSKIINHTHLIEGVINTLKEIKEAGIQIAIVSNTTEFSHDIINKSKLKKYIDYVVFSCDFGLLKPNSQLLKYVLIQAKLSKNETVVVGDKIDTDIEGALQADIDSYFFSHENRHSSKKFKFNTNKVTTIYSIYDIVEQLGINRLKKVG